MRTLRKVAAIVSADMVFCIDYYFSNNTEKRVSHRLQDILLCNCNIHTDHCRLDNTDQKESGTNQ